MLDSSVSVHGEQINIVVWRSATCILIYMYMYIYKISLSIQSLSMLQQITTVMKQTKGTDYNILGLYYNGKGT